PGLNGKRERSPRESPWVKARRSAAHELGELDVLVCEVGRVWAGLRCDEFLGGEHVRSTLYSEGSSEEALVEVERDEVAIDDGATDDDLVPLLGVSGVLKVETELIGPEPVRVVERGLPSSDVLGRGH